MYIPFEQLPDQSRVWVYQANRPLTGEEMEQIRSFLKNEMNAWAAHGATAARDDAAAPPRRRLTPLDAHDPASGPCRRALKNGSRPGRWHLSAPSAAPPQPRPLSRAPSAAIVVHDVITAREQTKHDGRDEGEAGE